MHVDLRQFDPVFIDLETRSCCDLKTAGGHKYATDESTNLLTVSWSPRVDEFHLWLPALDLARLDPTYHTHFPDVILHDGPDVPDELTNLSDRVWCAHNAWTFDEHVWRVATGVQPADWLDSYPLALAAGLPGSLDHIAKRLWGEGKYKGGTNELKKHMMPNDRTLASSWNVPVGSQVLIGRYNVQDVRLLRWLWDELCQTLRMPSSEWDVMQMSRRCNDRGVKVDRDLVVALVEYCQACQGHALKRIIELTEHDKTPLQTDAHLRSRTRVFAWLKEKGVSVGSSLRKELVRAFIDEHDPERDTDDFEPDDPDADASGNKNLAVVVEVLLLRMSALKITNSKLTAALHAIDDHNIIRALHAYWGAHTGRDAHRRVQVGNLPRGAEGVKPWKILKVFDEHKTLPYEKVVETMPIGQPGFRHLLPDDAASAVLRSIFVSGATDAVLAVADLSTIEARVIAQLAGEQWLLDAFKNDVDVYLGLGYRLFGPFETWRNPAKLTPKKHPFRQVCKIIELGCLYQMGAARLEVYGAASGIDWEEIGITPQDAINGFRLQHPAIAGTFERVWEGHHIFAGGFWRDLFENAVAAVKHPGVEYRVGYITFEQVGAHLYVTLPSGRQLCYRHAKVVQEQFFGRTIDIVMFMSARYGPVRMSPGKWAENVTQAVARDIMMVACVRMEDDGIPVYIRVHDEVAGGLKTESRFPDFMRHMTTPPEWFPDFTLDAEGARMPRYAKSPPPGSTDAVWRNGKFYKQECPKCKATCKGQPVCPCGWSDPYGV